jgi:hypothetical protein
MYVCYLLLVFSPSASLSRNQSHGQVTGMALVRCILGKFLGVVCHCFPPVCMYNYVYNTTNTRETRFNRHVRKLHITSAPCLIPARKIALVYYYAIMLLDLRGLQCNWNIGGAPYFTLYFIPQEYTVSFVVLDFTVTLQQFRMA